MSSYILISDSTNVQHFRGIYLLPKGKKLENVTFREYQNYYSATVL